MYKGVRFRSRLEASYAAFFDEIRWQWEYEPYELSGWAPDFLVKFPRWRESRSLLVEVRPYDQFEQFYNHTAYIRYYDLAHSDRHPEDGVLLTGAHPRIGRWQMSLSEGGGEFEISDWVNCNCNSQARGYRNHIDVHWLAARNIVQWHPETSEHHLHNRLEKLFEELGI